MNSLYTNKSLMKYEELNTLMIDYISTFFEDINDPFIIHAGAHKGEVCIDNLAKKFPKAQVHSFEPCKESYNICLKRKIDEKVENLYLYNMGLSDMNEIIDLNISTHSNTNSTYKLDKLYGAYTHPQTGNVEKIKVIALKDWLPKNIYIDLLILNIEGCELKALKGLGDKLKNIKCIHLEVNVYPFWENCAIFKDINEFLTENGFYLAMNTKRRGYAFSDSQHNAVYIHKELL